MSFANPWMFLLALPLGVAAWRMLRRASRSGIRYSATVRLPANAAGWRAKLAALTPYVMLAGLAMMIVAAARPRSPLAHEKKSLDAIAIAMAVDISGSMNAQDLAPKGERPSEKTTRLAVVKQQFAKFVDKRPDDLIGLVTFATYAATVSSLTADHGFLLQKLEGVKVPPKYFRDAEDRPIGNEVETSTAMGDGILTALGCLKDAKPTSKIIILLSDGRSNTGEFTPEVAATTAAKMGVKIYIIGIGVVPEYLEYSNMFRTFKKKTADMKYEDLVEALDFDPRQLESIAKKTGGRYFAVGDRDSMEDALEEIDQLETTEMDADVYDRWEEHFVGFLVVGALLVALAVSLSMTARRRMA